MNRRDMVARSDAVRKRFQALGDDPALWDMSEVRSAVLEWFTLAGEDMIYHASDQDMPCAHLDCKFDHMLDLLTLAIPAMIQMGLRLREFRDRATELRGADAPGVH